MTPKKAMIGIIFVPFYSMFDFIAKVEIYLKMMQYSKTNAKYCITFIENKFKLVQIMMQ